jgi:hypothetical protein
VALNRKRRWPAPSRRGHVRKNVGLPLVAVKAREWIEDAIATQELIQKGLDRQRREADARHKTLIKERTDLAKKWGKADSDLREALRGTRTQKRQLVEEIRRSKKLVRTLKADRRISE